MWSAIGQFSKIAHTVSWQPPACYIWLVAMALCLHWITCVVNRQAAKMNMSVTDECKSLADLCRTSANEAEALWQKQHLATLGNSILHSSCAVKDTYTSKLH